MSSVSNQSQKPKGVELRKKNDGSVNPKYVDVLEEDKPVAGQKFVCISFLSPEHIIKERSLYNFNKFLNKWDLNKSLEKYNQFLRNPKLSLIWMIMSQCLERVSLINC